MIVHWARFAVAHEFTHHPSTTRRHSCYRLTTMRIPPAVVHSGNHRLASSISMVLVVGCTNEPDPTITELECNIPRLFEERCGGSICHSAGESTAAGLDLTSPGVEERVAGVPGSSCTGLLADPAAPEASLLFQKVADAPTCGARMPINGEPLTTDEQTCLRDWISGLVSGTADDDTGDGSCVGCVCEPDTVEDCYSDIPDTLNVGICVGGMHTCEPDGLSWGACEGEVIPHGENCFTAEDENCDGTTPDCTELWSLAFGDELSQTIRSAAVDSEGNVYSLGDFEGLVSFGGDPLLATPSKADISLAKHDRYGNPVWSRRYGDSSNQYGAKILVDAQGNLIVLGRIFGKADFGGGELKGEGAGDLIIVKLDSDGNHIWSRSYGDKDPDRAERIVVDSQGDVILTGSFTTAVDYGSGTFTSAGMRDAFVLKLDGATGAHVFSRQIGGVGDDYGVGVGVDANDNVVIAGRFQDTIDLGGDLTSSGGSDIYVAKLSPIGAPLWSESFGGDGEDGAHDLAVASDTSNIVLLGYMSETVDFGGDPLVSAGMRDIFVATLDPDGGHLWSERYGDAQDQFTSNNEANIWMTLALGSDGEIYFSGALVGEIDIDGVKLASSGINPDVFYVRMAADGSYLGGNRYGGNGTDIGLDIRIAPGGQVIVAGRTFASGIDFGPSGRIETRGDADGFLAQLP